MNPKTKAIILGLAGLISLVGFFVLFSQTGAIKLLQNKLTKEEIAIRAEQAFSHSILSDQDLEHSVDIRIQSDLFRYAQLHFDENTRNEYLSLARWSFTWRGNYRSGDDEQKERIRVFFTIDFDFNGNLVRQECEAPKSLTMAILPEEEALARAKFFLASNGIDTGRLEQKNNTSTRKDSIQTYKFEFEGASGISADIIRKYTLEIAGDVITKFVASNDFNDASLETPESEDTIDIIFGISIMVFWMVLIIVFIVVFVKRLRHDELDFKRAKWVALRYFS